MATHALYFVVSESGNYRKGSKIFVDLVDEEDVEGRRGELVNDDEILVGVFPYMDPEIEDEIGNSKAMDRLVRIREDEGELDLEWLNTVSAMVELAFKKGYQVGRATPVSCAD